MVPDVLLHLLTHAYLSLAHVGLLIFDECHHAEKNNAYNAIMQARGSLDRLPHRGLLLNTGVACERRGAVRGRAACNAIVQARGWVLLLSAGGKQGVAAMLQARVSHSELLRLGPAWMSTRGRFTLLPPYSCFG